MCCNSWLVDFSLPWNDFLRSSWKYWISHPSRPLCCYTRNIDPKPLLIAQAVLVLSGANLRVSRYFFRYEQKASVYTYQRIPKEMQEIQMMVGQRLNF